MRRMAALRSAATSYIPAAVLAALTLFVFYTFRDYGPASAVRQFHDDVRNGDLRDLQRVTAGSLDSPQLSRLVAELRYYDSQNPNPRIAATQMIKSDEASVITVYPQSDRNAFFVWIVRKEPNQPWRVDPDLTIRAMISLLNRDAG
jgi:hypothetical protein